MRRFYTGLLVVGVAVASFAVGRSTSGGAPSAPITSDSVASIDTLQMQSVSRKLPEQPPSFLSYLIFPPEQ